MQTANRGGSSAFVIAIVAAGVVAAAEPAAEPWSRWRGAGGAGQGGAAAFPAVWTDADWAWAVDLPGRGHASPVVRDGRIYTASAAAAEGLRFVTSHELGGGDNTLVALRPPHDGSEPEIAYRLDRGVAPYLPTPVACDGRLYLWGDRGVVTCVDAATGTTLWRGRVGGTYSASPIAVGGTIVNVSEEGEVVTIAAAASLDVLGRVPLGAICRATPAVVGGRMVFRSESRLHAIDAAAAR